MPFCAALDGSTVSYWGPVPCAAESYSPPAFVGVLSGPFKTQAANQRVG